VLLWISWPIARPFATVLDLMFNRGGMNPFEMPRQALLALMRVQQEKGVLSEQEAQILDGAMGLAGKKATRWGREGGKEEPNRTNVAKSQ
ncbi:hypothetical protein AK812_SmicGene46357, partial [Symbiodinium microadriaticum]